MTNTKFPFPTNITSCLEEALYCCLAWGCMESVCSHASHLLVCLQPGAEPYYNLAAKLTRDMFFEIFTIMAPNLTDLQAYGIILRVKSEDNIFSVDLPVFVSLHIHYLDHFTGNEDGDYLAHL